MSCVDGRTSPANFLAVFKNKKSRSHNMGIHGLQKLITDHAPGSITETEMKNLFNRKIAVDASMSLYQFLIAVRIGGEGSGQAAGSSLTDETGETTS